MSEAEKNPIIIIGSSRSDGDTFRAVQAILQERTPPIVDLRKLNMSYYDYALGNLNDDFIPLAEQMVEHDSIILATPVYWYSMSAIMKTFLDRWNDLLYSRKELGRRLAGKELYLITSYASDIPKGFEDPFVQTCEYLEMHYKGCLYFYAGDDLDRLEENPSLTKNFSNSIWEMISVKK
jgi:putative NADPH-quinone reductase